MVVTWSSNVSHGPHTLSISWLGLARVHGYVTSRHNRFRVLVRKMSIHDVAGVWFAAGAARSIGSNTCSDDKG
jgi:hypothetical protein